MVINVNTKLGAILKQQPGALETIINLSPKFVKLRNPLLRKIMAGRTSIATAAKVGGCSTGDFLDALEPLGFEIDKTSIVIAEKGEEKAAPDFLKELTADKTTELDVRPVIETGKDPLNIILEEVKKIPRGHVLKIINSFEPTPLMHLLGKQGFESYAAHITDDLVETYFYKTQDKLFPVADKEIECSTEWGAILKRFEGRLTTVDVRELKMPLPMHTILESLEKLPAGNALFVHHKRIPVFLLPELEERKLNYRVNKVSDTEVQLLIYR